MTPTGHTLTDAKQIMLLAASEEAYCAAASVLQPALKGLFDDLLSDANPKNEQLKTGLHLLEEAMQRHNNYADSLK